MTIRIFVVENHPLFQKLLVAFLNHIPDYLIFGIASTAREALSRLLRIEVDIVLVSNLLPDVAGIEFIRTLHAHRPHLPCILLASSIYRYSVDQATNVGVRGYIIRGEHGELQEAIAQVVKGGTYLSRRVSL